jgi:2-haloalkanoic acid dehalogenase type II
MRGRSIRHCLRSLQNRCNQLGRDNMATLPLIVFDVNETLLDLETTEPTFERIFGEKGAMRLWFANLVLYSEALTVAGCYVPFNDIGSAVMKMLADTRGIKIDDGDEKELAEKFSTMPPHREVPAALRKLRDAGFRLFTFTNNPIEVQKRQLEYGGIADLFEQRFSVEGVKRHKPYSGLRLRRKRTWCSALPTLSYRLSYMGHAWRRVGGLGSRASEAGRQ